MMTWNTAGLQDPKDFYKNVSQHKIVFIQEYALSELHIIDEDYMGAFIVFLAPMDTLRPKRRICSVAIQSKDVEEIVARHSCAWGLATEWTSRR